MAVVATEDFTGPAGTPLNGKTTTTGGLTWQASALYQSMRDSVQLNGSGAAMSTYGIALLYVNTGAANHYAQVRQLARINAGSPSHQVVCAAVAAIDDNNWIALCPFYGDSWFQLIKCIGGEQTIIDDIMGLTLASGDLFRLERNGTNVKAFQNGAPMGNPAGYTVDDAVFNGVTTSGLWVFKAFTEGVFDDFEAGTLGGGGGGATITLTTGPADNAVLQRGKGGAAKAVPLGGAYSGTAPADLQWRLETEASSLVPGYDWAVISGASISGGSWSATVNVPPDTARTGYRINVRSRDAGGAVLDSKSSNSFTVGVLVEAAGQSNMQAQFNGVSAGPGLANKCAWWSGTQWVRTSSMQFTAAVAALSDLLGLPVGFATTAVSASGAREHAPAHTSTDGAVSTGQYWASFTTLLSQFGGDIEGCLWYQGEANVGQNMQQYKDAVNARIAGIKTATGRTGAGEFSFGIVVMGKYSGVADADAQSMRETHAEIAATTPGAFVAADAITYAMADAVHLAPAEYVQLAYCEGRSMAVAMGAATYDGCGPRVNTASIAGDVVTVSFVLNGATGLTGSGALTGWEYYNGSAWAAATGTAVVGNTLTFTAPGATQIRYLYGAAPSTTNILRGNVKAHAGATSALPVEPTRQAVAVTDGMPPIYVRPLIWDGQRMRRMGPGDVIDPAIKALFT